MKNFFYFLMTMPLMMAFMSCSDKSGGTEETPEGQDPITWGEITGNLNAVWDFGTQQSYATSNNVLAQTLLPTLIDMLNATPEAEAYLFNDDKTYSQFWSSNQPNDPETGLYKENGTYVLNGRDLTLTYTDGQTGETKTGAYKIVSLSDTQLVLYKDIMGIWGTLGAIIEQFDKYGITPQSAYKIITYTKAAAE